MLPKNFSRLAERLMRCPAAPYCEDRVRAEVKRICLDHGLACRQDKFGNLLIRLRTAPRQRPLVLAAHMDHPGFQIKRRLGPNRWLARFQGGVPDAYFRRGLRVRLMPGAAAARLGARVAGPQEFELHGKGSAPTAPEFAVWEMEDFELRGELIHGRACDDLIGVAAILATLIDLRRARRKVHVIGVISRAEEVGFHGALAVGASRELPRSSMIVSLETSRELPPVKMGQGVILRVGDRSSIFDSAGTRFLAEAAGGLKTRSGKFPFQRALMSGGTCEATAYQELGFQCAAVCVALGNYHNCAPGGRIAAEFVNLADAIGMVRLLVEAARQMPSYEKLVARLPARLEALLKEARRRLIDPRRV